MLMCFYLRVLPCVLYPWCSHGDYDGSAKQTASPVFTGISSECPRPRPGGGVRCVYRACTGPCPLRRWAVLTTWSLLSCAADDLSVFTITLVKSVTIPEPFSAILAHFQIMRCEFCVFCMEPLQPTQGSWLVPLEPPKSPKRGPF